MGGALARLAARKARKRGTKVIYTAHGFHFYKGSPLSGKVIFYPIEKSLARYTDCLITINDEDYNTALSRHFKARNILASLNRLNLCLIMECLKVGDAPKAPMVHGIHL